MPLTTLLVNNKSLLHMPVLIFQPPVSPRASDSQSEECQNRVSKLGNMCSY